MTANTAEAQRPTKNEVNQLPSEVSRVTSVSELNKKARQDIDDALKNAGVPEHELGLGVTPPTEQPALPHPLAKSVGAENVGHEEFNFNEEMQSKHRDVKSGLKGVVRSILGGGSKIRQAPGKLFSKLRRGKIAESAKIQNKHDSRQLDFE